MAKGKYRVFKRETRRLTSVLIFAVSSCNRVDVDYVKSNLWQHEKGFKVGKGDFIDFDNNTVFDLKSDTIYYKGRPRAVIVDVDSIENTLLLFDVESKAEGLYVNTQEFTR